MVGYVVERSGYYLKISQQNKGPFLDPLCEDKTSNSELRISTIP